MKLAISVILKAVDMVTAPLNSMKGAIGRLQKGIDAIKPGIKAFAGGIATVSGVAIAAASGLFAMTKNISDLGSKIAETSAMLGISSTALQEYQYIGELTGVSADDLSKSLEKLTVKLGQGDNKQLEEALNSLGLSTQKLKQAGPDKVLDVLSDAFKNVNDPQKKAAIAFDLFGKSGVKMTNVLNMGSAELKKFKDEAHKLGYVMSEEAVQNADSFGDSLDKLKFALQGIQKTIAAVAMPQLQIAVEGMTDFVAENREKIVGVLIPVINVLSKVFHVLMNVIIKLSPIFDALSKTIEIVGNAFLKIVTSLSPLFETLGNLIIQLLPALDPLIGLLVALIPPLVSIIQAILPPLINLFVMLMQALQPVIDLILRMLPMWQDNMVALINAIAPVIERLGLLLIALSPLIDLISFFMIPYMQALSFTVQTILKPIELFGKAINNILGFFGIKMKQNTATTGNNMETGTQINKEIYSSQKIEKQEVKIKFDNVPNTTKIQPGKNMKNLDLSMGYANL